MIRFYDVDKEYINYLKMYDNQIPNIDYNTNNKFVCGIVLSINGFDYYAPISHLTDAKRTSLPIYDNERIISTIRFSFMFPALNRVLKEKDFASISKSDRKYADLLQAEYSYCNSHIELIYKKAEQVYKIGCNENHKLYYTCCKFKLLEHVYMDYCSQK